MKTTISLIALAGIAAAANAQTLVEYQTGPSTTFATLSASFSDSALSADDFAAGSGVTPASGATYNFNGWADGGIANTDAASAFAENEFFSFGFDVTGIGIDLDSAEFRVDRSGTGPNQFSFQYAINGGSLTELFSYSWGDADLGVDFTGIDLTSLPILNTGDSVEFYIIPFGADSGGASAGGTFDLETIDFNGADPRAVRLFGTVIPAPASAALLGLGGLVATRRRR